MTSGKTPGEPGVLQTVEVPRAKRGELAVRDFTVDDALDVADQAMRGQFPAVLGTRIRAAFEILLPLAREALERKLDESGSGLPPVPELDVGGDGDRDRACGSCGWRHCGESEEDGRAVVGKCHVDPPVIWKGTSTWRFLRPEVGDRTPGCSRWKARSG